MVSNGRKLAAHPTGDVPIDNVNCHFALVILLVGDTGMKL